MSTVSIRPNVSRVLVHCHPDRNISLNAMQIENLVFRRRSRRRGLVQTGRGQRRRRPTGFDSLTQNADARTERLKIEFDFFLSPVVNGFERLLSLGTVHHICSAAIIKSQRYRIFLDYNKLGNIGNQTRVGWVWSENATTVLCRPPPNRIRISFVFRHGTEMIGNLAAHPVCCAWNHSTGQFFTYRTIRCSYW